jgi:hypothetical protein
LVFVGPEGIHPTLEQIQLVLVLAKMVFFRCNLIFKAIDAGLFLFQITVIIFLNFLVEAGSILGVFQRHLFFEFSVEQVGGPFELNHLLAFFLQGNSFSHH